MSKVVVKGDHETTAELARTALDLKIDAYEAACIGSPPVSDARATKIPILL
jgi:hypothetical protein